MKHAEANTVKVCVGSTDHCLCIQVTDDGKGFDTRQKRTGIGISNMMNRVELFNGELEIESSPGAGCAIKTLIPV